MSEAAARALGAGRRVDAIDELASAAALPDLARQEFPGPVAEALFYDDATVTALQGPVGSGKTTTVLKSRLRRAVSMPRSVIDGVRHYKLLVVRETYRQLWSTTIPDYLGVYPKHLGEWTGGRGGPVTYVMPFEDDYGKIVFTTEFMAFGDDIVASMRGFQTSDTWLHEMDTNPLDVLVNAMGRIDRYPDKAHFEGYPEEWRTYGQIVGDMNAPEEDNWACRVFHDPAERAKVTAELTATLPAGAPPITINFHRQPGYGEAGTENLRNLASGYYPKQIALNRLAGRSDMTERMVYNRVTHLKLGDPVFEREFNPRIHVAPQVLEVDPTLPLRIGLDQGFKGAAVIAQLAAPYHWRILDVVFYPAERLMAAEFGRRLRDRLDTPRFAGSRVLAAWGDMAGEHGASQAADENASWNAIVGAEAGFRVRAQRIGTNRITPRLEAVRAALEYMQGGQPGLLLCPTCKPLTAGFSARYVWTDDVNATGDKRKVPDKSIPEANPMDGLQYLLLSEQRGDGRSPQTGGRHRRAADGDGPETAPELDTAYDVLEPHA